MGRKSRAFSIGPYDITQRLGAGGMGEVWLAERDGVPMVLKTILPELAATPRFVQLFSKEAAIAAQVESRRVVRVLDQGQSGRTLYLVLELVDGLSLQQLMASHGRPLAPALVTWLGVELARALQDVHEQRSASGTPLGIVHRDISPGNVLLSETGEVKVTDFGIARMAEVTHRSATTVGNIQGKATYMSPEQAAGERVDARSDLYSLGVVLYRLVSGETPYQAPNDVALLQQITQGRHRPLLEQDAHLPVDLVACIEKAMAFHPADRFANAAAFATALESTEALRRVGPQAMASQLGQLVRELRPRLDLESDPTQTRERLGAQLASVTGGRPAARRPRFAVAVLAAVALGALGAASVFAFNHRGGPAVRQAAPAPLAALPAPSSHPSPSRPLQSSPQVAEPPSRLESSAATVSRVAPRAVHGKPGWAHRVMLSTQPACSVLVNGRNLGAAPVGVSWSGVTQRITLVSAANGIHYDYLLHAGSPEALTVTIPRGSLHLRIYPYSDLTLDGKPLGEGPYPVIPLYAGQHQLQIVNRALGINRREMIAVGADEQKVFRLQLVDP